MKSPSDSPDPLLPKKVAVDRYRKKIKEAEANRADANYAKAAAVGALAGLAARLRKTSATRRAALGAGAGLLTEGAIRTAGAQTKDYYGERSRAAKKSEKIPIYGGLGVAGYLAHRRYKDVARKFKIFQAKHRPIELAISAKLKARLITASALAGGITAADAATSAAFPVDEETRKEAALGGLKRGLVYGSALAASEPVLHSLVKRGIKRVPIKRLVARFKRTQEFRSLDRQPITIKTREEADARDVRAQRRKLALYAGGALLGAAGLGILARRPSGDVNSTASPTKPTGRGTLDRAIKAKSLREERGYIHMRPMMPGESKRFDKLPAGTKAKVGKFSKLAVNPNLSSGEKQKFRQAIGKLRSIHRFERTTDYTDFTDKRRKNSGIRAHPCNPWLKSGQLSLPIEFSSFVKDIMFKDLPAAVRKDVRTFHPSLADDTLVSHYGMSAKELAGKADPQNIAGARKNVCKLSKKACADEVLARRGKKFVLLNNDRMVDGHHFLAKAERGRVTSSLHVVDLTPSRFQSLKKAGKHLNRKLRPVEFGALDNPEVVQAVRLFLYGRKGSLKTNPMVRRIAAQKAAAAKLIKKRPFEGLGLEARLRRAVEFVYASGAVTPESDLPPWVMQRRQNKKKRERIKTIEQVAGIGASAAALGSLAERIIARRKLGKMGGAIPLSRSGRKPIYFRRQQLREEDSDRWADPRLVAIGEQKAYYSGPGNTRVRVHDLPVAHAQVLRKVYSDAGKIRRTTGKVTSLLKDTADVAAGRPRRTDTYGRPQRREWEKPWFHKATTDAAIGAATVGGLIALKKSPKLRGKVMSGAREIKRKVNKAIPDFFAGRKFTGPIHHLGRLGNIDDHIEFAVPIGRMANPIGRRYSAGIQRAIAEARKDVHSLHPELIKLKGVKSIGTSPLGMAIRKMRNAREWKKYIVPPSQLARRFRINHPVAGGAVIEFDDIANYAGWDVRDPRGRSARVFAPGSRRRVRREKEWHERVDNQRKLLSALAAAGTLAGAGAGSLITHRVLKKKFAPTLPKPRSVIEGPWSKGVK